VQFHKYAPEFTINLLYLIQKKKKLDLQIYSNVSEPGACKLLSLMSRYMRYTLTRYRPKGPKEIEKFPLHHYLCAQHKYKILYSGDRASL
jgi:hypothetical protein